MDQGRAVECGVDTSCYVNATIGAIDSITRDIDFWSQVQIATLIATVFFGVLATVMIALQGDENRYWTRPVGIVATALVTGIASLTSALHVPDNIDKLIDIRHQFTALVNNFEYDIQRKSGLEADEVRKKFADESSLLNSERLKLRGSAGRLNIGQAPALPPPIKGPQ